MSLLNEERVKAPKGPAGKSSSPVDEIEERLEKSRSEAKEKMLLSKLKTLEKENEELKAEVMVLRLTLESLAHSWIVSIVKPYVAKHARNVLEGYTNIRVMLEGIRAIKSMMKLFSCCGNNS